jgi:hypothetical protein
VRAAAPHAQVETRQLPTPYSWLSPEIDSVASDFDDVTYDDIFAAVSSRARDAADFRGD